MAYFVLMNKNQKILYQENKINLGTFNLTYCIYLQLFPSIVLQNCLTLENRLRPCMHNKKEEKKIIMTKKGRNSFQ